MRCPVCNKIQSDSMIRDYHCQCTDAAIKTYNEIVRGNEQLEQINSNLTSLKEQNRENQVAEQERAEREKRARIAAEKDRAERAEKERIMQEKETRLERKKREKRKQRENLKKIAKPVDDDPNWGKFKKSSKAKNDSYAFDNIEKTSAVLTWSLVLIVLAVSAYFYITLT